MTQIYFYLAQKWLEINAMPFPLRSARSQGSLLVNYQLPLSAHGKQWTWLIMPYITFKVTKSFTISLGRWLQVDSLAASRVSASSQMPHTFYTSSHPSHSSWRHDNNRRTVIASAALRSTYQHTQRILHRWVLGDGENSHSYIFF